MHFSHIRTGVMIKFLKRNWRQIYIVLALITDSVSMGCSALLAYWIRNQILMFPPLPEKVILRIFLICWFTILSFASMSGLYRSAYHTNMREQYAIGLKAYIYSLPALFSIFYIFQIEDFPRRFIFIFLLSFPFFFSFGRAMLNFFNSMMRNKGFGTFNALVIGFNGQSKKVIEMYRAMPYLGCHIKAIIKGKSDEKEKRFMHRTFKIPVYDYKNLEEVIETKHIERVLIPSIDEPSVTPELLNICKSEKIDLKILSPEFDKLYNFSHIHDIAGIPLYSRERRKTTLFKAFIKRVFDIISVTFGILLSMPIVLIASIAILIEDGRPIFFTQKRSLAENGKVIKVIKFRTMKKGSEEKQKDLYKSNENSGGLFFIKNDPRVTRVGKFLRKYSIDEIPQLFNVLIGDMSLVGPRPLSLSDIKNITPENRMRGYYTLRNNAKPGVTGLWQISGRREVDFKDMVLLDLYYIENQSIMFDLEILFATVGVVLFARGGH